ncbi:hypothetical protein P2H45_20950, partial [Xanthomonas perforans]
AEIQRLVFARGETGLRCGLGAPQRCRCARHRWSAFRDAKITEIDAGASEIQRLVIARGTAGLRQGP